MKDGEIVYSTCGEVFEYDDCDFDVGDCYYKGEVKSIKPSELVNNFQVDTIVESMEEMLYEEVGEVAQDNLHLPPDKEKELLSLIRDFMDENVKISCYKVINVEECVVEEEK